MFSMCLHGCGLGEDEKFPTFPCGVKSRESSAQPLALDITQIVSVPCAVQESASDVQAFYLGLGPSAPKNLALRKKLGMPGAPFGGLGFFDPRRGTCGEDDIPEDVTAERIQSVKLQEFRSCTSNATTTEILGRSIYFWGMQPIFDVHDRIVGAEILVRARNGSDSAPYEDVKALCDASASREVQQVYANWKCTEIIDWPLRALQDHPILRKLGFIAANVRPLDMNPKSAIFQGVSQRLREITDIDRELLLSTLTIEVTEDQEYPDDIRQSLKVWKELGFRVAHDDTIGDLARQALDKQGENFHTTGALEPLVEFFDIVKVDIEWAGFALFLGHPSYNNRSAIKEEILRHARDEDLVYVPEGSQCKSTGFKHSVLLGEFADWAKRMIMHGKHICVENTVRQDDDNNAFALAALKTLGLDIFGVHSSHFCFQGGLCGAKAFEPRLLALNSKIPDAKPVR